MTALRHPRPHLPGLIDAHCHLDYAPMADDVEAALATAAAAGVEQFLHIGCTTASMERAVTLASTHAPVFASIGIHPHDARHLDDAVLARIETLAADPKVVAIGETGLDFYYDHSPRPVQHRALGQQVELARRLDLPIVLHIREAHDEALAILREAGPRTSDPGMVHCFTGDPDDARRWLDAGFHLSFSGIATFKKTQPIRDALRLCPRDRILLETDAPFLAPEPIRGAKNEPANVAFTCVRLAQELGCPPEELARDAATNTRKLLRLPMPAPGSPPADDPRTAPSAR